MHEIILLHSQRTTIPVPCLMLPFIFPTMPKHVTMSRVSVRLVSPTARFLHRVSALTSVPRLASITEGSVRSSVLGFSRR